MKIIKAEDILKALPFEEKFKESILSRYPDKLTSVEKMVYDEMAWNVYKEYFNVLLDENIQMALEAIKEGTETAGDNLYGRMRQKTESQMEQWIFETNVEERELETIRAKLKSIIQATTLPELPASTIK